MSQKQMPFDFDYANRWFCALSLFQVKRLWKSVKYISLLVYIANFIEEGTAPSHSFKQALKANEERLKALGFCFAVRTEMMIMR
jgi:hypothetical protein